MSTVINIIKKQNNNNKKHTKKKQQQPKTQVILQTPNLLLLIKRSDLIADVEPPKNVHVITARENGVLIVQWDKPSCDGPYIRKYVVQLCPVQEATSNNCSGKACYGNYTPRKCSFRGLYFFQPVHHSVILLFCHSVIIFEISLYTSCSFCSILFKSSPHLNHQTLHVL